MTARLLSFFIFFACLSCSDRDLKTALDMAGDNRAELEEVLNHYRNKDVDPLKYDAAVFLIKNMPGHYSYNKKQMEEFAARILPIIESQPDKWQRKDPIEDIAREVRPTLLIEKDIKVITAQYLIDNIDLSFDLWQKEKWARHLDFEQFCEILLPYKVIDGQPLDKWKESLRLSHTHRYEKYKELPHTDHYNFDVTKEISNRMKENIDPLLLYFSGTVPFLSHLLIDKLPYGSCHDICVSTLAVMRSKGIPVSLDYTPQWTNRSMGHTWNTLFRNDGSTIDFIGADTEPGAHNKHDKKAKVFRHVYSINHDILDLWRREKHLPETFRNQFIEDVTEEYMKTCDFDIPVIFNKKLKNDYGYICAFDNARWVPIDFGKRRNGMVSFKNIGPEHILLPAFMTENGPVPFNRPFKLKYDGTVEFLEPDKENCFQYTFFRKYPMVDYMYFRTERLLGGEIQAANREDFSDARLVYRAEEWAPHYSIEVDTVPPHRYWRYVSSDGGFLCVSELIFVSKEDTTQNIKGRIIGTSGSYENLPGRALEQMFDDDLLTFFDAPVPSGGWGGMDFGEPKQFSRLIWYPATDGNNIEWHDEYQLYYWDDYGWAKTGESKIAYDAKISFDGIPANGLYLLNDLTKGKEIRIFTIENGEKIWW